MPVNLKVYFRSEDAAGSLFRKKAKWHRSCHLKFAYSKLLRVEEQKGRKREHPSTARDDQWKSKHKASDIPDEEACIFCSQPSGKLHQCATMGLDNDLRKMATDLEDTRLLATFSCGDLVAIEAKCHYNCLSAYKSRYRSLIRSRTSNDTGPEDKAFLARAFAEI